MTAIDTNILVYAHRADSEWHDRAVAAVGGLANGSAAWAIPCIALFGVGMYMLHNTLQLHATQMAPASRGAAVALFAFFLFTGQSVGVWIASRAIDTVGTVPVFAVAAIGLPLLALEFRRRLSGRRNA